MRSLPAGDASAGGLETMLREPRLIVTLYSWASFACPFHGIPSCEYASSYIRSDRGHLGRFQCFAILAVL